MMPDDDYPHPLGLHVSENREREARASLAAPAGSAPDRSVYRANFLWGRPHGSIEEAGYEFANGQTEEYRKEWWGILLERVKAQNDQAHPTAADKD